MRTSHGRTTAADAAAGSVDDLRSVDTTVAEAARVADTAARRAGVTIRQLSDVDDFRATCRLFADIWQPDPSEPPTTAELLRALTAAGNYVAGAFDGDELVAASVGFFGPPTDKAMHSHIAGVSTRARGRNVGFALKVHQRAWAMRRGVSTISWTFDPLVRRNAYFNVSKLAAVPVEYRPNFYGGVLDGINKGDDTDRLLVDWPLTAPSVVGACTGVELAPDPDVAEAEWTALGIADDGYPAVRTAEAGSGHQVTGRAAVLLAVPRDI
ncbi:MAG: GNAT family N-acetyltransferase, partial [Kutzneria sp.]|nr:GNAT family N-acetyltransferase [Kutzneria sp.]